MTTKPVYKEVTTSSSGDCNDDGSPHSNSSSTSAAADIQLPSGDSSSTIVNVAIEGVSGHQMFCRRIVFFLFVLYLFLFIISRAQASLFALTVLSPRNATAAATTISTTLTRTTPDVEISNHESYITTANNAPPDNTTSKKTTTTKPTNATTKSSTQSDTTTKVKQCTPGQLQKIEKQLPTNDSCFHKQWTNKCPITIETSNPQPNWLFDYYRKETENVSSSMSSSFVAIDVGCGTANHAIQILRMGTRDSTINDSIWEKATGVASDYYSYDILTPIIATSIATENRKRRNGIIHCIEPLPITFDTIKKASEDTKYNEKGLVLHQLIITEREGWLDLPITTNVGNQAHKVASVVDANDSCSSTDNDETTRKEKCKSVYETTLDSFVLKHIPTTGNINVLLSHVSAFDFDILLGGMTALARVEYLEFGYNWKGSWVFTDDQIIPIVVDFLNELEFTCYWAGEKKLWRITGCFLRNLKNGKFWSNFACANRKLAPGLAAELEKVFLETID